MPTQRQNNQTARATRMPPKSKTKKQKAKPNHHHREADDPTGSESNASVIACDNLNADIGPPNPQTLRSTNVTRPSRRAGTNLQTGESSFASSVTSGPVALVSNTLVWGRFKKSSDVR